MTREMLDERLDGLLDDALRLPEAPAGLTDRVLGATAPLLAERRRAQSVAVDHGVLARIGPGLLSLAATIALAAGAAIWVASVETPTDTQQPQGPIVIVSNDPPPVDDVWNASIDDAITLLALQVEMVDLRWDETWSEPADGVEDSVLRWELEAMSGSEMVF